MASDLFPTIKRSGSVLDGTWLRSLTTLRVERGVGLVGRATMRFLDTGYSLSASNTFSLGTAVTISQPDAGPLLEGTVTGVNLELSTNQIPQLVVVVDDAAYKLMRGTEIATYLNGTYTSVLQKICSRHGLRPQVQASTLTMEYVLQAGSDLAFLDMTCERLGYSWFVDDNKVLVAKKFKLASPAVTLTFGLDLDSFSVRASGLRPTEVSVHGWDPDQQREVTDSNPAAPVSRPPAFIADYLGSKPSRSLTRSATSVADRPPLTTNEAKVMADAYFDDWTSAAVVARGSTDVDSRIKPGSTIRVKDAGPTSGDYLVTSVEHAWNNGGFLTRFECGPRRPAGLVDTLGPRTADPGFAISGLVIGVVTDANDPDKAGRVKIRYAGINGQIESPWARVVTLGGGSARGAVFSPEVNDEVLVGFEHSDTRRPVVLGGLFSKRNTLPTGENYVANGKVNYRRITSRRNHMIELADGETPTTQHILLKHGTKATHRLRIGADRFDIEVGSGVPLTIKAGSAKFDISNSGDVTIEGTNVTIKATAALKLEAGAQASLKGTAGAAVEGAKVDVKASGMATLEASGIATIKGSMVMIN